MADISILSRLLNGLQRNVDLSANSLVVGSLKVGSVTPTELTKAILDRLVALQNGTDVNATYHTHDGRYYTESELSAITGTTGSDLIGDDNTYSNFTPITTTVKGALAGIDSALSTGNGKVKVTSADTNADYLNNTITAGAGLSKSTTNPGADETLDLAVNVDDSTIEINSDTLRVKDGGITNAKVATGIDAAKLADGSVSSAEFQRINSLTSNAQDQLDAKVAKAGSSMNSAANITFSGGGEVLGLPATPSAAGAAASKAYVDAVALGLAPKKAVRVATTVAGTLASSFENGDTIDGVVLATGDRILIKDQASAATNGIYIVQASGAPVRATDFDSISPIDEINGAWVPVQFGTVNAGRVFVQYGVVATLGTDAINFEFYNPIASLIGGDMVTVSGSTISVDLATTSGLESTNAGDAAGQLRVKLEGTNPTLQINGSNELGAKLNTGATTGNITTSATGLKANTDGVTLETASNALQVKDLGISTAKIAAAAVTEAKLAASVAGAGLSGGAGTALSVNVDDSTIEINSDTLRVKDLGITTAKLADNAVTTVKILNANVTLSKLASDSVDENKIVSTAHDASMTGGSGSKLAVAYAPRGQVTATAGESMAANTSFLVRWAINGETAGRAYKADKDTSSADKFYAFGIALSTSAVSAAGSTSVTFEGTHTLGSSDANFGGTDIGKAVYLTAAGAFSVTPPTTVGDAVYRIGTVQAVDKIWVGGMQINGIN